MPEVSVIRPRLKPAVAQGDPAVDRASAVRGRATSRRPGRGPGSSGQAGNQARVPQHRQGGRHGLSRRPDAALPDPPQPERDRRHRPGGNHAAGREERRRWAMARITTTGPGPIELPLAKEGAYLVMIRGDNLYASGIVLVSPIELEVLEEPASGRVRVTVRDARSKDLLPKVQVKVIGSNNPEFFSGETDLRGVFVAEGVHGQVTAVVRKDTTGYAFYRGTTFVGQPPAASGRSEARHSRDRIRRTQMPALQPGARRQPEDAEFHQQPQADPAAPGAVQARLEPEKPRGRGGRVPLSGDSTARLVLAGRPSGRRSAPDEGSGSWPGP